MKVQVKESVETTVKAVDRHPRLQIVGFETELDERYQARHETPDIVEETIESVRLALGAASTAWARYTYEVFRHSQWMWQRPVQIVWENDWQLLFRNRHHSALRAMNNGDRRAPRTLARDAPVAYGIATRVIREAMQEPFCTIAPKVELVK